jgi:hypothetical protein
MKLAFVAAAAALLIGAAPALAQDVAAPAAPPAMTPNAQHAQAVIHAQIEQLSKGQFDGSGMTDQMAQAIKGQLPAVQDALAKLGPVQSMTFLGEQEGADAFRVVFEKGPTVWIVHFDAAGKVDGMGFQPENQGAAPQG